MDRPGWLGRVIAAAQLAAIGSVRKHPTLSHEQASQVVALAVWDAAKVAVSTVPAEELQHHLMMRGIRALAEVQAGLQDRSVLIARLEALPEIQRQVYSLRREHGMSDWQIAAMTGRTEQEVVDLMLRALYALQGLPLDDRIE